MSVSTNNDIKDLIVFGEDWGSLPSSTQYLVAQLAANRKVLWVNSIGLRQPSITVKDTQRVFVKLSQFIGKNAKSVFNKTDPATQEIAYKPDNITVLNPITIPAPQSDVARKLAVSMLANQINPMITKLKLNNPILWTSLPTAVDMINALGVEKVVYYCGDDFSALAGVDHDTIAKREDELIRKSDLIIAASETLTARFPRKKSHCIEHGVDFELFTQPCSRAEDLPKETELIAGFYGSINEWFDLELLATVATKMSNWHFVLIGEIHIDVSSLKHLKNIHFLGAKPHSELPRYSQHWNASILPFIQNDQIKACNPLKLSEYLAAGQPIISTHFPASEQYQEIIHVVDNPEEMINVLYEYQFGGPTDSQQTLLRDQVQHKSWLHQSQRVASLLDAL